MTLGNRIKSRREELGISQAELAAVTKISQPGISQIESGKSKPSVKIVPRLAKALHMTTDELLGVDEERRAG